MSCLFQMVVHSFQSMTSCWRDFTGSLYSHPLLCSGPLSWFTWLSVIYPFTQALVWYRVVFTAHTAVFTAQWHRFPIVLLRLCESRPLAHLYTACSAAEMSKPRTHRAQHLTSRGSLALVIRRPGFVWRGPSACDHLHSLHTTFKPGS